MNTRTPSGSTLKTPARLLAVGLLLLLAGCGSMPDASYEPADDEPMAVEPTEMVDGAPEPTAPPASPTPVPTATAPAVAATAAPTATPVSGEYQAAAGYEGTASALGELEVEYPQAMDPATSNTVKASVYIPDMLASAEPARFERVTVDEDRPQAGALGLFHTTILLHPRIRAEITSPTLDFEAIYPAEQEVALDAILAPTTWAWTVLAPASAGEHTFVLSLFHGAESVPAWVGSFALDVTALAEDPTPAVVSEPTPEPSGFLDSLIGSSGDILAGILGLAGVLLPLIIGARAKRVGRSGKK